MQFFSNYVTVSENLHIKVTGGLTMSLIEKFKSLEPTSTGLPCGVSKLLDSMTKADKEAFNYVLFEQVTELGKRVSNTKIYEILVSEGYNIAPSSIAQHRRKHCRCFVGANVRAGATK
jgi:hypothetical protein